MRLSRHANNDTPFVK